MKILVLLIVVLVTVDSIFYNFIIIFINISTNIIPISFIFMGIILCCVSIIAKNGLTKLIGNSSFDEFKLVRMKRKKNYARK